MAITDLTEYKTKLGSLRGKVPMNFAANTTIAGRLYDMWMPRVPAVAVPTTAVATSRTTTGAFGQQNPSSGQLSILGAEFAAMSPGVYIIADLLSHQGGLVANVTSTQTTNLPTAALTRYTDGVGVMAALRITSQVGATTGAVAVSYTNQAGTSGQVSPSVVIGNTGFREANRLILLPLVSGDTGVRAVASVTLSVSTATAGVMGVTLFKPLFAIAVGEMTGVTQVADFVGGGTAGGIPAIVNDACLFAICIVGGITGAANGMLLVDEN